MEGQFTRTEEAPGATMPRRVGIRVGVTIALVLLCSVLLPMIPILLGVVLVLAFVLHAGSRDLRPYVENILRVPVARAGMRHARLSIIGGIGVILIVSGAVGATTRAQLRSKWEQRQEQREVAVERVSKILQRAEELLAAGDVAGAEFVLLDAEAVAALDSDMQAEVDELLARMRRSRDAAAILDILTRLPQEEFEALEEGAAVPEALDFRERALTLRAVELAQAQLEEARRIRAQR